MQTAYAGSREVLQAEIALDAAHTDKYYLCGSDAEGQEFDPIGCDTRKELVATIQELKAFYPGLEITWL